MFLFKGLSEDCSQFRCDFEAFQQEQSKTEEAA